MLKALIFLMALISVSSFANLDQAPPHLSINRSTKAVFVDFLKAESKITFDLNTEKAIAITEITFNQAVDGMAIFDLVETPLKVLLNGKAVQTGQTSMNGVSNVRYVNQVTAKGTHKLLIENEIKKYVNFYPTYVKNAFWMSDLSDRRYIEQYLPTNLEYDQYKMDFEIKILGKADQHQIYANGEVTEISKNHFKVSFPEVYTASSVYFHMIKEGSIPEMRKVYRSIDGRDIPVVVYTTQSLSRFMNETLKVMAELEKDYGPWPHNQMIVYGAGQGGMEHCGATITSFRALGHELIHSYFARGVMPSHGNSGWVDEAIASWRDAGYRKYNTGYLSRTDMAAHSIYRRTTDRDAYNRGMKFIGHLGFKFEEKENFKLFLRSFFTERKFKPFKTHEFVDAIEKFYNEDVSALFDRYVYGKKGVEKHSEESENPMHPKVTEADLYNLL